METDGDAGSNSRGSEARPAQLRRLNARGPKAVEAQDPSRRPFIGHAVGVTIRFGSEWVKLSARASRTR